MGCTRVLTPDAVTGLYLLKMKEVSLLILRIEYGHRGKFFRILILNALVSSMASVVRRRVFGLIR